MYIVNISFMVSAAVHGNWYDFVHNKFLAQVEQDPLIKDIVFSRVLGDEVQTHFTYSLQMFVEEISHYTQLRKELLNEYQTFSAELFDAEVTHFVTVMKVLKRNW